MIQNTKLVEMRWKPKEGRRTPNSEVVERKYRRNRAVVYACSLSNKAIGIEALRGVKTKISCVYERGRVDDITGGVA